MTENDRAARAARTLVQFFDVVCQMTIPKFKVNTDSKSFILYFYFNGASTSPFTACSVNNKECEEEAIITTKSPFPKCSFSSDVFSAVSVVTA